MGSFPFLTLYATIILNVIEFSSHSEGVHTGEPIPSVLRGRPLVDLSLSLASPHFSGSPVKPSSNAEPPHSARSTPELVRLYSFALAELTVAELASVRLGPHRNQNQRFEIRTYTFPREARIQVREKNQVLVPIPTESQTVLSTSNGEVLALLGRNLTILRGIYMIKRGVQKRVKINMHNGKVEDMTLREREEAPLGMRHPISGSFERLVVGEFRQKH